MLFVADTLIVVIAASAVTDVTNLPAKSEQDAATSQLDVTDQTMPPKPKSKSSGQVVKSRAFVISQCNWYWPNEQQ